LDKRPTTEDLVEEEFRDPRAGKRATLPESLTRLRQKLVRISEHREHKDRIIVNAQIGAS
jgi:hypothetical protein